MFNGHRIELHETYVLDLFLERTSGNPCPWVPCPYSLLLCVLPFGLVFTYVAGGDIRLPQGRTVWKIPPNTLHKVLTSGPSILPLLKKKKAPEAERITVRTGLPALEGVWWFNTLTVSARYVVVVPQGHLGFFLWQSKWTHSNRSWMLSDIPRRLTTFSTPTLLCFPNTMWEGNPMSYKLRMVFPYGRDFLSSISERRKILIRYFIYPCLIYLLETSVYLTPNL